VHEMEERERERGKDRMSGSADVVKIKHDLSMVFLHNVLFIHCHEMYMIHKSRVLLRVLEATRSYCEH